MSSKLVNFFSHPNVAMNSVWKETCVVYLDLEKLVQPDTSTAGTSSAATPSQPTGMHRRLQLASKDEAGKLDIMLKDFATLLQLIGRMSVLFLGRLDQFSRRMHC